jgi:3-hydroxybutyryl-CoA dehydrogenase
MSEFATIAAAGAGRMGQGMAVAFALAGHPVLLIDLKTRSAEDFSAMRDRVTAAIEQQLQMLCAIGLLDSADQSRVAQRISIHAESECEALLATAAFIFEGVPETLDAKRAALGRISRAATADAVIASTTSTILSTELQAMVTGPERFLNAHWLNPAYLVPLVELSPGDDTAADALDRTRALLESIGKVPVVCKASPGYIVPRIQALAMNEAARLVEEGVASAEDIDKATRYGLGFRFAILGLLEFIDWGGGDILYHASHYLQQATGEDRFAPPESIERNMAQGHTGLAAGRGFMDYAEMDVPAYQQQRLQQFAGLLQHLQIKPVIR